MSALRRALPLLLFVTAVTCDRPPTMARDASPEFLIVDGAHNSGNTHFYFLPPAVDPPTVSGVFDRTLSPVVEICALQGAACTLPLIARFTIKPPDDDLTPDNDQGNRPEYIKVSPRRGFYRVRWHTAEYNLDVNTTYRISVLVGATTLGIADVDVVADRKQLRNVNTGEFVPLLDDKDLPIKFRIEQGAVAVVSPGGSTPVGPAGGQVTTSDGSVGLSIPAGALAGTTSISATPVASPPAGTGPWSQVIDLGPSGTTFATPVTLTLAYNPQQLPAGIPASALGIYTFDGTGWDIVPGSTVNLVDNTVSVPISHFSFYVVAIIPTNANWISTPTTLTVGQTTVLSTVVAWCQSVSSNTCVQYPLTNVAVRWFSTQPGVAPVAVGPTYTNSSGYAQSPPIVAQSLGAADIVSQWGSIQSQPLRITVVPALHLFVGGSTDLGMTPRDVGLGQEFFVSAVLPGAAAAPVNLTVGHSNASVASITSPAVVPQGQSVARLNVRGLRLGRDTLVVGAPGYGPDTLVVDVGLGQAQVVGLPGALQFGDSAAVRLVSQNPSKTQTDNAFGMSFALSGGTTLRLSDGRNVITSATIPDGTSSTSTFYVTAIGSGSGTLTITNPSYVTNVVTIHLTTSGQLGLLPHPQTIPAWMGRGLHITLPAALASNLSVSLTNRNGFLQLSEAGTGNNVFGGQTGTFVVPAGSTNKDVNIYGFGGVGVDTVIAAATGYLPDTAIVTVVPATLRVSGWPTALVAGDSALVQVAVADQNGVPDGVGTTVTFALASTGGLVFSNGRNAITSIQVQQFSTAFYVKAVVAGSGSITITNRDFVRYTNAITVQPPPQLSLLPHTQTIPAWMGRGLHISIPAALASDLAVSTTNRNGVLQLSEAGTANNVFGGQTGTFVVAAGTTNKDVNVYPFAGVGVDTVIVAAPHYSPDTAIVTVVPATLKVTGWPTALMAGDSALILVAVADQNGVPDGVGTTVAFTLGATGGLVFSNGQNPITTIQVQQFSTAFYVKSVTAGAASITISNRDFVPYTNTMTVTSPPGPLYVTSQNGNRVTVYAPGADGDATPTVTIEGANTGLNQPQGIARDASGNLYVANAGSSAITVYAPGASDDATPIRTIAGSNTQLSSVEGLAIDGAGALYVASVDNKILVFAAGADGDVAPMRMISGATTGLDRPIGIALDASGRVYVANLAGYTPSTNSVTVYASGASGDVAPLYTIAGGNTTLYNPIGIAVDASGSIYVSNFGNTDNGPSNFATGISIFAAGSNGNVAPMRTISGSGTLSEPLGIAVDGTGQLYVAGFAGQSISVFASGAAGNVAPTRVVSGGSTKLSAPGFVTF